MSLSFYGAGTLLEDYTGQRVLKKFRNFDWQHGWVPNPESATAWHITGTPNADFSHTYLVARPSEQERLLQFGIASLPIGLPFAYTKKTQLSRLRDSILAVPSHSTRLTKLLTDDAVDAFRNFVSGYSKLKKLSFYVLLHPDDFSEESVLAWEECGAVVLRGADIFDHEALQKQRNFFETFEFVIADGYTSALAYAAASGARCSVWKDAEPRGYIMGEGPDAGTVQYAPHDLENLKKRAEWLFVDPVRAPEKVSWGLEQIGAPFVPPPNDLKFLLNQHGKTLWTVLNERLRALI